MPRDNRIYGFSPTFFVDESSFTTIDTESSTITFSNGGLISTRVSAPNPLTEMFAEKRAKKNGHKSTDKLLLELKASDEQNSSLRRELNTKTRENEEMKARILYLEEAILELEGK